MPKRWDLDALDGHPTWIRFVISIVVTGLAALLLELAGTTIWQAYSYAHQSTFWIVVAVFALLLGPTLVLLRRARLWVPMLVVGVIMVVGELVNHYGNIRWTLEGGVWTGVAEGTRTWDWVGGRLFGIEQPLLVALVAGLIESLIVPVAVFAQRPLVTLVGRMLGRPAAPPEPAADPARLEALFGASSNDPKAYRPKRDLAFWFLRSLGLVFGVYLTYLVVGVLVGARDWPLVDMYFLNPAATVHTLGKLTVLGALARIAAYNADVRKDLTLLLVVGHVLAVGVSLWLFLGTQQSSLFPAHHEFLLTSAIVDGALLVLLVVLYLTLRARAPAPSAARDVELRSFATAAMRAFFLVAGVLYTLILVIAVASRAAASPGTLLHTLFAGPDPAAINIGTKFATLAALCFMARARPELRPHLSAVLSLVLFATAAGALVGALGPVALGGSFYGPDGVARVAPGYLVAEFVGAALGLVVLGGLRKLHYHVDRNVTTLSPSAAECALALHDAVRETRPGEPDARGDALLRVDAYMGGIRGKRRGLLGAPFFLLEHLFSRLAFRPRFALMSRAEARHFLRQRVLRPRWERVRSTVPALSDVVFAIGDTLNALMAIAFYSSPRGRAEVGYVPPESRARLQGLVATQPPTTGAAAPIPAGPSDPAADLQPSPPSRLPAPRLGGSPMRRDPAPGQSYDYVVVGSGAGGAVAAYRLVQRGFRVCLVEAGGHYAPSGDFNSDELKMYRTLYTDGGLQTTKAFDFTCLQGRCLGGTTVINNAVCFELPPEAQAVWARYGVPLAALAPHYARVQQEIDIAVVSPSVVNVQTAQRFVSGVAGHNASHANRLTPAALVSGNFRQCLGCGLCNVGCMFVRKLSTLETYIPWAEAGGATIMTSTEAVACDMQGGRARGLWVRHGDGQVSRLGVERGVVVAAGALASSRLLMRSHIGGAGVGHNLSCNLAFPILAELDEEVNAFDGLQITHFARQPDNRAIYETSFYTPGAYAMLQPQYFERHRRMMDAYKRTLYLGTLVGSGPNGQVLPKPSALTGRPFVWNKRGEDLQQIKRALTTLESIAHHAGATRVLLPTLPVLEIPRADRQAALARFESELVRTDLLNWATAHPQGGNRMAAADVTSDGKPTLRVVDAGFKVVGTDNVYVADASLFPESATVNPQWTVMALASLAGETI